MTIQEAKQTICSFSKETVLSYLANATVTYYEAGGHHKAEVNKALRNIYTEELFERGEAVPLLDDLLKTGQFNGEGSF